MISVIMPTFMNGLSIAEAIESVQSQSLKNWELIIINDGSSDDTEQIVSPFLHDPRIKYLYQPNQGVSAARNAGLKIAKGKYIAYLDSDDIFFENHLEVRRHFLSSKNYDFVFGPVLELKNDIRKIYHGEFSNSENDCILPLMVAHKIDCLSVGYFDPKIVFEEDLHLFTRIIANYNSYQFFTPCTAEYRVGKNSMHILHSQGGVKSILNFRKNNSKTI